MAGRACGPSWGRRLLRRGPGQRPEVSGRGLCPGWAAAGQATPPARGPIPVHGRGPLALAASPGPDRGLAPAVDCWDGPDGEPIVHHGYTLTSKILFKDVIETINKYAFVKNE